MRAGWDAAFSALGWFFPQASTSGVRRLLRFDLETAARRLPVGTLHLDSFRHADDRSQLDHQRKRMDCNVWHLCRSDSRRLRRHRVDCFPPAPSTATLPGPTRQPRRRRLPGATHHAPAPCRGQSGADSPLVLSFAMVHTPSHEAEKPLRYRRGDRGRVRSCGEPQTTSTAKEASLICAIRSPGVNMRSGSHKTTFRLRSLRPVRRGYRPHTLAPRRPIRNTFGPCRRRLPSAPSHPAP